MDILVICFVIKLVDIPVVITGRWYFTNSRKISKDIVNVRVVPLFVDAWKFQGGVETAFAELAVQSEHYFYDFSVVHSTFS